MSKGKLAVIGLVAVGLLVANSAAFAGVIDPCNSQAVLVPAGGTAPYTVACAPDGSAVSGRTLLQAGFLIELTIEDGVGNGVPDISGTDFWLEDCDAAQDLIILCGGAASSGADSLTNSSGQTTMSQTTIAASNNPTLSPPFGCVDGMVVVVQGEILQDAATGCTTIKCHDDIHFRGFDLTGDGVITPADLSTFANGFPPNPFETCTDYTGDDLNTLADLSTWAFSFGPPGDSCPDI
jgi:hypothetical protein